MKVTDEKDKKVMTEQEQDKQGRTTPNYLPAKPFQFTISNIWAAWQVTEAMRTSIHIDSIPNSLNFSLKIVADKMNERALITENPIIQKALSLALIHEGIKRIESIEGLGELIKIGSRIHRKALPQFIQMWVKPSIQGLAHGTGQYHVELLKTDQTHLSKLNQNLELHISTLLRICLESVLMDIEPGILRLDYREIFKNDSQAFKKWIQDRIEIGAFIETSIESSKKGQVEIMRQFDYYRDVLGKKEKW